LNFFSLIKRKLIYKFKKKISIDSDNIKFVTLDDLFHYYGSDKAEVFKLSNRPGHGFSKFYEKKLEKYKNIKINILEIGSYSGASAAAFVKYLPNSNVFCFDVNISNFKYKSKKIKVFDIDIKNEQKVKNILKDIFIDYKFTDFDLIIDDGSHNLSDILISMKLFFKFIKKEGLYIIEDFKHPNYYHQNKNIDHILMDEFLKNLENKKLSLSSIISKDNQVELMKSIKKIEIFKGNLKDSDISFLTKS
tara:strand:+ start:1411 stop:2154 length:744 start_codon:yes stop_codon:yes gene_type:complete